METRTVNKIRLTLKAEIQHYRSLRHHMLIDYAEILVGVQLITILLELVSE